MRQSVRGWRSARAAQVTAAPAVEVQPAAAAVAPPAFLPMRQEPLRLGLGVLALAFYLWVIHSYKFPAGDVAVLGLGVGVLLRGGQLKFPAPLVVFLIFILWNTAGLSVTDSTTITSNAIINLVKLWVITFCVMNTIRTSAELRFLVISWLALFALYPVRGALYNQYVCHCTEFGRVAWNFAFDNPNDLAALSMIPLGLAAGVATVEKNKVFRWAAIVGVVVLALLVMLTQSRGALLALGVAGIMLPVTSRHKARDFALLGLLFGIAAVFAPKDVWTRLAGLSNASVEGGMKGVDPEGSAEARWQLWKVAGATFRDNPFLGVGAGMMPTVSRFATLRQGMQFTVRGERDTHSTYLRIAAETGLPGLLLYLVMWGTVFKRVRSVRRALRYTRPKDSQFLFFIELSMVAFSMAAIFGTYGALTFTYLSIAVAWLCAMILEKDTWYAGKAAALPMGAPVPATQRSR